MGSWLKKLMEYYCSAVADCSYEPISNSANLILIR